MKKDIKLETKINTLKDYIDIMQKQIQKIEVVYNLNVYDIALSDVFTTRAMSVMNERLEESNEYFQTHVKGLSELIEEITEEK